MGNWYDGLKKSENAHRRNPQNPQNPPGYSFEGFEGSHSERMAKSASPVERVSRVLRVPSPAESENRERAHRHHDGGFEGFEGAASGRMERFSSASTPPAAPGRSKEAKEPQASPKNLPCASGPTCQNPQNRTGVGFEGFVGSSPERITHFSRLAGWDADDWQAAFDERAAVLEYDADLTRADAERIARVEVFKTGRATS